MTSPSATGRSVCSMVDCDRPSRTRGLCKKHYNRWQRYGRLELALVEVALCSFDGCRSIARARGLCRTHYTRWLRHGTTALASRGRQDACVDDQCSGLEFDDWCPAFRASVLAMFRERSTLVAAPEDPLARAVEGPCWEGVGAPASKGYRQINIGRRNRRAHRAALAACGVHLGELTVDHLCRNRSCVNPAHLEAVTVAENTRRGLTALPRTVALERKCS